MNKKGNMVLVFVFLALSVLIITITAVIAPMGATFATKMYIAGEDILNRSDSDIAAIQDDDVRTAVTDVFTEAKGAQQTNIEVSTDMYQYSWVILLVLVAVVLFLLGRQLVEYGQSGFI